MPRTISAEVLQAGTSNSTGNVRTHSVTVDRPVGKGGTDQGPMGGELLLLALGGCFMSNLLEAVRTRSAPISDLRVTVEATVEGTPERMTGMKLIVRALHEDTDQLRKLVLMSERACIVANTLRPAVSISAVVHDSGGAPAAP